MAKFIVTFEGTLDVGEPVDELAERLMDALVDSGAEDPFVYADAQVRTLVADVVVPGATQSDALARGTQVIAAALASAQIDSSTVSARSGEPVPA
jgi:hypothetical protein